MADDLADDDEDAEISSKKLDDWGKMLSASLQGDYQHPVFIALAETIRTFSIPVALFQNLLKAFRQDQKVKQYKTYSDLLGYCQNSANPVGRIYLYLFRLQDEPRFERADAVCTALQLSNFWQDVKRDRQKNRVYIPMEDMKRFHCSEKDFKKETATENFRKLIKFEVDRTQELLNFGKELLELVPAQPRFEIKLFIGGGEAVLDSIRKLDYDTLSKRPVVSKWRKAKIMLHSWKKN
ncbi:MAG TPA: squalene synthase HpnC [Bacteroidetes bacterium]|nr:squalene synthase HpnC [Bacteroidota bacterium]